MRDCFTYTVQLYIRVHLKCNDFFGDFLSDDVRGLFKGESGDGFDTNFVALCNVIFDDCVCVVAVRVKPGLHYQRNRRKSVIQKIYDGCGNLNDWSVASGARLLRRLRC